MGSDFWHVSENTLPDRHENCIYFLQQIHEVSGNGLPCNPSVKMSISLPPTF